MSSIYGDEVVDGPIIFYASDASGRDVIAGSFSTVYGSPRNGVARFAAGGGSLDDSFQIGSGANGFVQRLNLDSGKIVLAGNFTSFNGTPCGYLVRLNDNGDVDTSFNQGGIGADDRIWTMYKRTSDNTWMILGPFRSFNGSPRQGIANLTARRRPQPPILHGYYWQ